MQNDRGKHILDMKLRASHFLAGDVPQSKHHSHERNTAIEAERANSVFLYPEALHCSIAQQYR